MDEAQIAQLEQLMAESVQNEAPDDVQTFIDAILVDGISQEEVDEVRQQAVMALQNPNQFKKFTRYLIASNLMEESDVPKSYDVGFVLAILGLVGVAQNLVTAR